MKYEYSSQKMQELFSPKAVRASCAKIFSLAEKGGTHFALHLEKLDAAAEYVVEVIRKNYPDLQIPYHSRWGHFQVGAVDRKKWIDEKLQMLPFEEQARARLDLVIVSVLLDAGSGNSWKYIESETGKTFTRSEGLAVASLHMFLNGDFSSHPTNPYQVDSLGLKNLSLEQLAYGFQVSKDNPLQGLDGRLQLLKTLGEVLEKNKTVFGKGAPQPRPGNLWNWYLAKVSCQEIKASDVLLGVLLGLGEIWPSRSVMVEQNVNHNLGDMWPHAKLASVESVDSLVVFHKLSQWLTYSILEVLEGAKLKVVSLDELTGLAEYRNGGFFLDFGVISLRDSQDLSRSHSVDSELIIEWRALTVILLDRIAPLVCKKLGKTAQEFPLAKVLEGGTWWAGRKIAAEKREGGVPPFSIISDGTVF